MQEDKSQLLQTHQISIFEANQTYSIKLDPQLMQKTVKDIRQHIIQLLGYSQRVYLYQRPITAFHQMTFINPELQFVHILQHFPHLCFTYNNTQLVQQHQFLQSFPTGENDLTLFLQILQGNAFCHQRYKIDSKATINFVQSLARRFGTNIYSQYYQLRVPLTLFGKDELICDTLGRMSYQSCKILLTVDSVEQTDLFKTIKDQTLVDFQNYYLLSIQDVEDFIVLSKQTEWSIICFLLPIIFQAEFKINKNGEYLSLQECQFTKQTKIINLQKKSKGKILLQVPLFNSLWLGQSNKMIFFLQQSSILHIFEHKPPYSHINSILLNSKSSALLDEQIPILHNNFLIMYGITRQAIALKYYQPPQYSLAFIKHFKWHNDIYGPIDCSTFDVLAVPLRDKTRVRVFYIYSPEAYVQISVSSINWKIWVSKKGCNNFSDESGIFGFYHQRENTLDVFNLHSKERLISLQFKQIQIEYIRFCPQLGKMLICSLTEMEEYSLEPKKIVRKQKIKNKYEIYYYGQLGQVYILTQKTFRRQNSKQCIRLDHSIIHYNATFFSKDQEKQMHSIDSIKQLMSQQKQLK